MLRCGAGLGSAAESRYEHPVAPRLLPLTFCSEGTLQTRESLLELLSGPPPEADWLVPNLIPKGSLIAMCGLEGVGKSVFAYTLTAAVGSGLPILGRDTVASRVLYIDEENGHRDRRAYIYRAWVGLGRPDKDLLNANLAIHGFALSISEMDWYIKLRDMAAEFKPALIIIDTVTPACRIKDENSNGEAAIAANKLRGVMNVAGPDCAALIMKHLRVNRDTGQVDMRGAKFWKGTVDAIWYHRRPGGRPRKDGLYKTYIRPEKVRAFGLQTEIEIDAQRIEGRDGLVLHGTDREIEDKKTGWDE